MAVQIPQKVVDRIADFLEINELKLRPGIEGYGIASLDTEIRAAINTVATFAPNNVAKNPEGHELVRFCGTGRITGRFDPENPGEVEIFVRVGKVKIS